MIVVQHALPKPWNTLVSHDMPLHHLCLAYQCQGLSCWNVGLVMLGLHLLLVIHPLLPRLNQIVSVVATRISKAWMCYHLQWDNVALMCSISNSSATCSTLGWASFRMTLIFPMPFHSQTLDSCPPGKLIVTIRFSSSFLQCFSLILLRRMGFSIGWTLLS